MVIKFVLLSLIYVSVAQATPQILSPPILSSYVQGVEHYNDTLLSFINYQSGENLKDFFTGLFQSVKSSHQAFSKSHQAAAAQHNKLNVQQASVQSQLDSQRTSLRDKFAEKAAKQKQLQSQKQSLKQAEVHLANTEKTLKNLEGAVKEAEDKVHEARYCLNHKRKKRGGLSSVFKEIKRSLSKVNREVRRIGRQFDKHVIQPVVVKTVLKPLERGICAVYNELTGHLRDQKRLREKTQRDAAKYRNTVNKARKAVQTTQARISTLTKEIQAAQTSIASLNQQISKLSSDQQKILQLKQKITKVDQHLAVVVNRMGTSADAIKISQAALLIAEIEDVVDFENVIKPLVEAGELISGSGNVVVPKLLRVTMANREKIQKNVELLQKMLDSLKKKYGDDANLFTSLE